MEISNKLLDDGTVTFRKPETAESEALGTGTPLQEADGQPQDGGADAAQGKPAQTYDTGAAVRGSANDYSRRMAAIKAKKEGEKAQENGSADEKADENSSNGKIDPANATAKEIIQGKAAERRAARERAEAVEREALAAMTEEQRLAYSAIRDRLKKSGVDVQVATEEEAQAVLRDMEQGGKAEAQIVSDEMVHIKRAAQENGSFMKAPNGKKTRLTEQQWLQTRTKAFREWYGDWELADKEIPITNVKDGQTLLHFATREDAEIWGKIISHKLCQMNRLTARVS